ncbi:MAG: MBL fold metallo-hydrolase [Clostridiales bacterium]|nr:MBL fold metallo-hydrolase [Clostridiales bacterium]
MDCRITAQEIAPGIHHLTDRMGMHCTLLVGSKRALLFDTAYGLDDLNAAVRRITDLPFQVILSHGHHDHACGSYQFDSVLADRKELPICQLYAAGQRQRVWDQALGKGVDLADWQEEDFVGKGCGNVQPLDQDAFDLGGLTARVIALPGHTPGSIGLYVEERQIMLAGDHFNPTVWLFFDEALPMADYLASMERMLALPFAHILCPHGELPFPRAAAEDFYRGCTEERIAAALPQPHLGNGKTVYGFSPAPGHFFCFDGDKLPDAWKNALTHGHC